ncbi:large ribosomal subunit protein mL46-like isoform X2 [Littorina saxatilis]|uniref:Large ribosomal subunit protein mL46 n=1 Tax=Littorina saxatilis TaxID=31220 RepID=A0AAN9B923_9CAEN
MATIRVCSALTAVAKRSSHGVLRNYLQLRQSSSGALCTPGQWQLVSAVCLQRQPIITAEKTELEQQYADMMAQMELETSLLSDQELRAIEDKAIEAKRKQQEENETGEGEVEGARVTALDLEDAWEAEAKQFTPAARITEADEKNDQRSVERRLDKPLVLLVKQTLGDKSHWVFPQGPRQEGESMRQAAERVLQNLCGQQVGAQFLGNAPCGFHQYRFPPKASIGTGAKVFFYKAWYKEGDVIPDKENSTDYMWVTFDELSDHCSRPYLKSIGNFLVDL